ncbi:MurR/RpiR family transcriptional regulator [Cryobacterium aureum]|uniref:MurR/RpiR family transcriptional regulator n=1 Tax=Cryobacterium aureum TaxID=995037 RepID=UPI001F0C9950|nr:MurR/RpiR family transcriptional regulator [Cryobacterium aureum]
MTDDILERPDSRTVLVRMRAAMPSLRPTERRIAELFLAHPADAVNLSIAELAVRCDTSTTSVVRFYKRIGYEHYKDLRIDLTRETTREDLQNSNFSSVSGDINREDSLADIVAKVALNETLSIADTAKVLDTLVLGRAVDLVKSARRIDSFGVGASSFVGLDLQQKLTRIGRTALNWPDPHSAWTSAATLDASCVAIAVSHTGSTIDTVEFLKLARAAGAATIAITNFGESPLANAADIVLTTAARETRFRSGALGSRIAQLMVIDCLFTAVAQASFDESMTAVRTTYEAVHSRSLKGS